MATGNSISNLASSVDWSKLLSRGDARNALVGSALGGLLLGGASLAQDRDPEEEKSVPVKDALIGALLGGTAAYGIPKGLSLFRDSGAMAPDDDKIDESWISSGLTGAATGASTVGAFTIPTLLRAIHRNINKPGATWRQLYSGVSHEMGASKKVNGVRVWNDGAKLEHQKGQPIRNGIRTLWNRTHGSHYSPATVNIGFGKKFRAGGKTRVLGRAGKYAAIFAALNMLRHGVFGNSAKDNFKN